MFDEFYLLLKLLRPLQTFYVNNNFIENFNLVSHLIPHVYNFIVIFFKMIIHLYFYFEIINISKKNS